MKSIFEMNLEDYAPKEGDIKVDSSEFLLLLKMIEKYHNIICSSLKTLSSQENDDVNFGLEYVEYIQNKYVVLGDLRREQKKWYDILKKLDDKEFVSNISIDEADNLRSQVFGFYLDAKTKRENLQKEVDEIKQKKYKQLL